MVNGCDWLGRECRWRSYILGQILRAESCYILGWREYILLKNHINLFFLKKNS